MFWFGLIAFCIGLLNARAVSKLITKRSKLACFITNIHLEKPCEVKRLLVAKDMPISWKALVTLRLSSLFDWISQCEVLTSPLRYGSSHWVPGPTRLKSSISFHFPLSLGVCRVFFKMQSLFFAKPPMASVPSSAWDRKAKQLTFYFAILSSYHTYSPRMILSLAVYLFKCSKVENPRLSWKDMDLSAENKVLPHEHMPQHPFPHGILWP